MIYDETGALRVTWSDGQGYKGLYAPDGSTNVTETFGSSYVGSYAPDGSLNVQAAPTGADGLYAPSGALYVNTTSHLSGGLFVRPQLPTPTLSLSFLTGTLDPLVTFARTTTGTNFNSSGLLVTTAINTARFDYDPVTLLPRGLLMEAAATNIAPRSRYAAGWTLSNATTSGTVTSLQGDTVSVLLANAAAAAHRTLCSLVVESLPYVGGDVYVYSFDVLLPSGSDTQFIWARLRVGATGQTVKFARSGSTFIYDSTAPFGTNPPPSVPSSDVNIASLAGGWVRIEIRGQASSAAGTFSQVDLGFSSNTAETTAGTANTTIAFDNLNVVKTSTFGLSRINTTVGAVTRGIDTAILTGSNFTSWYNDAQGTFVSEASSFGTGTRGIYSTNDGSLNNLIEHRPSGSASVLSGGVSQMSLATVVYGVNTVHRVAVAYRANNYAVASDGGTLFSDSVGLVPVGSTALRLGELGTGGSSLNGHIRSLTYYNKRLPNVDLLALTVQ